MSIKLTFCSFPILIFFYKGQMIARLFIGQLSYLPSAPRMIRAGKMPPFFPHKIPGIKHVKRIFSSFERKKTSAGSH